MTKTALGFFWAWFFLGMNKRLFGQDTLPICGTTALYQGDTAAYREATARTLSTARKAAVDPNTIFTIPVVFVVYHLGETVGTGSNVSDAVLNEGLNQMNDLFRARNNFAGLNDAKIQFAKVQNDNKCNVATGIVRVNASGVPNYAANGLANGDNAMLQSLRALHSWNDRSSYITIELVHKLNNAAGFAGYLGGYVVLNAPSYWWGLMAHEMGHCLDLRHTFEGDNGGSQCPPNTNPDTQGDLISDTDPHKNGDRCTNFSESSINPCSGVAFGKLLRNIMSYNGPCWDRFTPKQIERMRNSLVSFRPQWANSQAILSPPTIPNAPSVTSANILTGQKATLTASNCAGTVAWYNVASGGTLLGTNLTYTTPTLSVTTRYYVSCNVGGCLSSNRGIGTVTVGGCPPSITHTGTITAGTYLASQSIISTGRVASGTKYYAGNSITLNPGFSTGTNGYFVANIQNCPN